MLLKKIIKNLPIDIQRINIEVLSLDSRQIKKKFIFFAINVAESNGEDYISSSIRKGAVVVVCYVNCNVKNKEIQII